MEEIKRISNVSIDTSKSTENTPVFRMTYIDGMSKEKRRETTRAVFLEFQSAKWNRVFNKTFFIDVDDDGVIQNVHAEHKHDPAAVFTEDITEASGNASDRNLIFERGVGGKYHIRINNSSVGRDFVEDVVAELNKAEEVKAEDILADRYYVVDVRQNGKYVHIAPTAV